MVRRWSRINDFNFSLKTTKKIFFFKKNSKYRMFKITVSTRKFFKKYTKFRRKSFNRLRHKTNWLIYSNVFKFWSLDYLKTKSLSKKVWLINFFKFSYVIFNISSVKNLNFELFFNFDYHILNINAFQLRKFSLLSNNLSFWKNFKNLSIAYFYENNLEISQFPSLLHYDNVFYEIPVDLSFSSDDDFLSLFKNNSHIITSSFINFYIFFIYLTILDL